MAFEVKKLVKEPRIWILTFFLIISIASIPSYKPKGVEISFVQEDSPFYGTVAEGQVVTELNGQSVTTLEEYSQAIDLAKPGDVVSMVAGGTTYRAIAAPDQEDNTTPYIGVNVRKTSSMRIELGLDLQGGARVKLLIQQGRS
jgi:PDZ domain-containing secreted protein